MIRPLSLSFLTFGLAAQLAAADTEANCEAMILGSETTDDAGNMERVISYHPADDFVTSVYDEDDGTMTEIDGAKIQAVLCTRPNIMPTLRDFPMIATRIPLSISPDFDTPDSALLTLYYKDGEFHHLYAGPDLSEEDSSELTDIMEVFNLQPKDAIAAKKDESK